MVCRPARRSSDPAGPADEWSQTSFILLDAYTPAKIAERVDKAGVAKAILPLVRLLALALLAGVLIACGAALFTGNNQTVMAGCDGLIGMHAPLRGWDIV